MENACERIKQTLTGTSGSGNSSYSKRIRLWDSRNRRCIIHRLETDSKETSIQHPNFLRWSTIDELSTSNLQPETKIQDLIIIAGLWLCYEVKQLHQTQKRLYAQEFRCFIPTSIVSEMSLSVHFALFGVTFPLELLAFNTFRIKDSLFLATA